MSEAEETTTVGDTLAKLSRDPEAWMDLLLKKEGGALRPTLGNAIAVLEGSHLIRGLFAFDEQAARTVFLRPPPWRELGRTRYFTDEDATRLVAWLELHYRLPVGADVAHRAVQSVAAQHSINPLTEWLSSLKWDGKPRADTWLCRALGATDDEWSQCVGRAWLISAVARAFDPGCQVDHVLVLEGHQGAGKSSALRALVGDEWFSDDMPDLHSKDAALAAGAAWVIELSEIEAMRRSELAAVKAFISRRVDSFRPPYGREQVVRPRRCVFAATTNESSYLRDSTGNRRFWPVICGYVNLTALKAHREQLWAEAVHLYRAGTPWRLAPELYERARQEQELRQEIDPWEPIIAEYLETRSQVTSADLLRHLGVETGNQTRAHEMRVGSIARQVGWDRVKARIDGQLRWIFRRRTVPTSGVPTSVPTSDVEGRNTEIARNDAALGEVFLSFPPNSLRVPERINRDLEEGRNSRNSGNIGVGTQPNAVPTSDEGGNKVGTIDQSVMDEIWGSK